MRAPLMLLRWQKFGGRSAVPWWVAQVLASPDLGPRIRVVRKSEPEAPATAGRSYRARRGAAFMAIDTRQLKNRKSKILSQRPIPQTRFGGTKRCAISTLQATPATAPLA